MRVPSEAELREDIEDNKKSGRPRSEQSKRAILDATRRLLTHNTVQKLSIESIAKKAGVGKTTIYRWWPNKTAVVMEAVFTQPGFNNVVPSFNTPAEGVHIQLERIMRQLHGKNGRMVAEIIGDAQNDLESIRILITTYLQDRYNMLGRLLDEGRKSGDFRADLDIDLAIDCLLGPIFFRLISGQAIDEEFEKRYIPEAMYALR